METDGQTDGGDCISLPPVLTRSVKVITFRVLKFSLKIRKRRLDYNQLYELIVIEDAQNTAECRQSKFELSSICDIQSVHITRVINGYATGLGSCAAATRKS